MYVVSGWKVSRGSTSPYTAVIFPVTCDIIIVAGVSWPDTTALEEARTTIAGSPSSSELNAAGGDRGGVGYGCRKLPLLRGMATAAEGLDILPVISVPARALEQKDALCAGGE